MPDDLHSSDQRLYLAMPSSTRPFHHEEALIFSAVLIVFFPPWPAYLRLELIYTTNGVDNIGLALTPKIQLQSNLEMSLSDLRRQPTMAPNLAVSGSYLCVVLNFWLLSSISERRFTEPKTSSGGEWGNKYRN